MVYSNYLFNLLLKGQYKNLSYLPWGSNVNKFYHLQLCIAVILNYELFHALDPDNVCASFAKSGKPRSWKQLPEIYHKV